MRSHNLFVEKFTNGLVNPAAPRYTKPCIGGEFLDFLYSVNIQTVAPCLLKQRRASAAVSARMLHAVPWLPDFRKMLGGTVQYIYRFFVGGLIVSLFAVAGDVLKPKSFAGLFGAAPSVALATLGLAIISDGKVYAALEARSMLAGAFALLLYAWACMQLMVRYGLRATAASSAAVLVWLAFSLGTWALIWR